jgi:hypothetical protein
MSIRTLNQVGTMSDRLAMVQRAVEHGADVALDQFEEDVTIDTKTTAMDYVTDADVASQEVIIETICACGCVRIPRAPHRIGRGRPTSGDFQGDTSLPDEVNSKSITHEYRVGFHSDSIDFQEHGED